jgi:AcrR family transcriptional regulator
MAEIAREMGCSLRTLYGIAPSKDELVLIILDRRLHRFGREAVRALEGEERPLTRLRAYLRATNRAVQPTTAAFAQDFAAVPGATELNESHAQYIVSITRALLEEAVANGDIQPLNTPALAHILGRLGNEFARASLAEVVGRSPRRAANEAAEIILDGLLAKRPSV